MAISTRLTELLKVQHPILSAPMDIIADGRFAATVSGAGAFGIIGGGYGNEEWLRRELDVAGAARVGVGFITWSMAKNPRLLDMTLERKPAAVMLSFGEVSAMTAVVYGLVGAAGLYQALFWKRVQGRWMQPASHHA